MHSELPKQREKKTEHRITCDTSINVEKRPGNEDVTCHKTGKNETVVKIHI